MQIAESGHLATQIEQPLLGFGIFQIPLLIEKGPLIVSKIHQRRLRAGFKGASERHLEGQSGKTCWAGASTNGHDPNLVSCLFVLSHVDRLQETTKPSSVRCPKTRRG